MYVIFLSACFIITILIRMLPDRDEGNFFFQNRFNIL